jgi:hypothetical protein
MNGSMRTAVGAALSAAALLGAASCASSSAGTGKAASNPTTTAATTTASAADARTTPAGTVSAWVADVIENRLDAACALMAQNGKAATGNQCTQGATAFQSLRSAWTKNVVTLPPKVTVSKVSVSGDSGTVADTDVTVDGHTLRALELIGASGQTGSFSLTLSLQRLSTGWYVSNLNINA